MWLLWGCLILPVATASTGVSFVPQNSFYHTYSLWTISFSIDIGHYSDQLHVINETTENVRSRIMSALSGRISSGMARLSRAHNEPTINASIVRNKVSRMRKLKIETTERFKVHDHNMLQFEKSISNKVNLIKSTFLTTNPQSRSRRSLLPWAGDLLKSLFGTATKDDLT